MLIICCDETLALKCILKELYFLSRYKLAINFQDFAISCTYAQERVYLCIRTMDAKVLSAFDMTRQQLQFWPLEGSTDQPYPLSVPSKEDVLF